MFWAVMAPMSSTAASSSRVAAWRLSREPKRWARILPAFCPTWRMPKANSSRDRSLPLDRSMAATRFSALFLPMRSNWATSSALRWYRSPGPLTRPAPTRVLHHRGPRPSMSMASRLAKVDQWRRRWAGHSAPVQADVGPILVAGHRRTAHRTALAGGRAASPPGASPSAPPQSPE